MDHQDRPLAGRPRPGTLSDVQIEDSFLPLVRGFQEDIEWYESLYGKPLQNLATMHPDDLASYLGARGLTSDDYSVDFLRWDFAEHLSSKKGLLLEYLNIDYRRPPPIVGG